mmetsp:Transcript_9701/g.11737  ORF Transcript_9701/g.11737 Transcript_9701/m.11737 type:complete len:681 (+) Transcript_9701:60-2102(+)
MSIASTTSNTGSTQNDFQKYVESFNEGFQENQGELSPHLVHEILWNGSKEDGLIIHNGNKYTMEGTMGFSNSDEALKLVTSLRIKPHESYFKGVLVDGDVIYILYNHLKLFHGAKNSEYEWNTDVLNNIYSQVMETTSKILGKGSFSTVYSVTYEGKEYAVKEIQCHKAGEIGRARLELGAHRLFQTGSLYKDIIRFYGVTVKEGRMYLVLEQGTTSLREYMKTSPHGGECINVMIQIGKSARRFYLEDLVHLDIKPENILLFNGTWKLADLGFCRRTAVAGHGTMRYMDPNLLKKYWNDAIPSYSVDIFALGCVYFEMLNGHSLYHREDKLKENPMPPITPIGELCHPLIEKMTSRNINDRPNPEELVKILKKLKQKIDTAEDAPIEQSPSTESSLAKKADQSSEETSLADSDSSLHEEGDEESQDFSSEIPLIAGLIETPVSPVTTEEIESYTSEVQESPQPSSTMTGESLLKQMLARQSSEETSLADSDSSSLFRGVYARREEELQDFEEDPSEVENEEFFGHGGKFLGKEIEEAEGEEIDPQFSLLVLLPKVISNVEAGQIPKKMMKLAFVARGEDYEKLEEANFVYSQATVSKTFQLKKSINGNVVYFGTYTKDMARLVKDIHGRLHNIGAFNYDLKDISTQVYTVLKAHQQHDKKMVVALVKALAKNYMMPVEE